MSHIRCCFLVFTKAELAVVGCPVNIDRFVRIMGRIFVCEEISFQTQRKTFCEADY